MRPTLERPISAEEKRYAALKLDVEQHGGVLSVNMGRLRDVHGAGKLGNIVVSSISEQLESVGLGHAPAELPQNQWKQVIVYRLGTAAARLIGAIHNVDEKSADIVRKFTNDKSSDSDIVRKIRELVCD